jgi:hypothetical protein
MQYTKAGKYGGGPTQRVKFPQRGKSMMSRGLKG